MALIGKYFIIVILKTDNQLCHVFKKIIAVVFMIHRILGYTSLGYKFFTKFTCLVYNLEKFIIRSPFF